MKAIVIWAGLKRPRHLFVLFLAVAGLVAAAFAWLSWRVIEQDRALERQRVLERRDAEAAAAANTLQRALLDILDQVAAEKPPREDGAVLAVFTAAGVEALPRGRLLFYPSVPPSREPPLEAFAAVGDLELRNPAQALEALAAPARSRDAAIRAGALLRIGRIHRKAGRFAAAIRAYEELSRIDGIRIAGEPADLAARHALCQILEQQGDKARLAREKQQLRSDLRGGRWPLTRPVYALYANWLGADDAPREALAEAVAQLWREWPNLPAASGWSRVGHVWVEDQPVFVFRHLTPGRMVALVAGPAFLERRWRGSLSDNQGRTLAGRPDSAADTFRIPAAGGLPWMIQVRAPAAARSTPRVRLIVAGLALIGLFAAAATYFITRALARELALARLQTDFVSAVSHEFRTPLTTIRQLAEMLKKRRVPDEARRQDYYDLLAGESDRLQRLVENLLDFRRMEAGAMEFAFEPLDPAGLVRGVVADFQLEAGAEGYQIELAAASDAPPVRGDRDSLRRAVRNLLENAVKYSPVCRTVWVELGRQAAEVAIRVRDRGIGIPAGEQASVFDKFVRGRGAKSANIPGTGLGLTMVRHIVRSHGGRVEVESRPGEGSTFTLLLPALE